MTELLFERTAAGMRIADQVTVDALAKFRPGHLFAATLHAPARGRSLRQHRLFMSLLSKVAEATGKWANNTDLLTVLKIALGHCDVVLKIDGDKTVVAKSIAFDKLLQADFHRFFNDAIRMLESEVFPEIADMPEAREIFAMLDGQRDRDAA